MRCSSCGGKSVLSKVDSLSYDDSGLTNVLLRGIPLARCKEDTCGEEEVIIENVLGLHDLIAKTLASQPGRLNPEEIRFLRTHLGFSGVDFAREVMGVPAETIAHWERGLAPMSEASERFLRVLILSRQGPFHIEEMRGFGIQKGRSKARRVFKAMKGSWAEV